MRIQDQHPSLESQHKEVRVALRTQLSAHPLKHLLPENFFPAEPYDIYDEAAFPHEWNYGLPDLPLPKQLSVTGPPREGDIDFEYSPDRPGWDDRWTQPSKKKFRRLPKRKSPDVLHFPQPAFVLPPPVGRQVEEGFHISFDELIDRARPVRYDKGPSGEFPTPKPPIQKAWHYIWQTEKVLACTGKGCQLCLR